MATTGGSIQSGEPVEVFVAANDLEAQVIKSYLESNDIPVMLQGDAVSKVYGFTVGGMAEGGAGLRACAVGPQGHRAAGGDRGSSR